jgi:predicted DNA-binding transcriptional regulator AlpA
MTELLSQAEVASLLGVTKETLANHRSAGKGPKFVKLVGRIKYRKCDVEAFIERSVRQSTSEIIAAA